MVIFFSFGHTDHLDQNAPEGQIQEGPADLEASPNLVDDSEVNEREEAPQAQIGIEIAEDIQEPFNVL